MLFFALVQEKRIRFQFPFQRFSFSVLSRPHVSVTNFIVVWQNDLNRPQEVAILYGNKWERCKTSKIEKRIENRSISKGSVTYRILYCIRETSYRRSPGDPHRTKKRIYINFASCKYVANMSLQSFAPSAIVVMAKFACLCANSVIATFAFGCICFANFVFATYLACTKPIRAKFDFSFTSRTFIDSAEGPEALFILQA